MYLQEPGYPQMARALRMSSLSLPVSPPGQQCIHAGMFLGLSWGHSVSGSDSQIGQTLCAFPVFFLKNNLRKDVPANRLLVCVGVHFFLSQLHCFLLGLGCFLFGKRHSPGPSPRLSAFVTLFLPVGHGSAVCWCAGDSICYDG